MKNWLRAEQIQTPDEVLHSVGGRQWTARLLSQRGIVTAQQALAFIDPDAYKPVDPFSLPGMQLAVERIEHAIRKGERILVWGDFDVDGQTSTAVLVHALRSIGGQVDYHVPVRAKESHGINLELLQQLLIPKRPAGKPEYDLLLTCDTGISANPAVKLAGDLKVDVIITDHHLPTGELPQALAVINPWIQDLRTAWRTLPGVGLAYKLIEALSHRYPQRLNSRDYLDLVAVGIVADLAEITGETRYLLQRGISALRSTKRRGIVAICQAAGLNQPEMNESHIAFTLAPRLNAVGRLADANLAVKLLLTEDAALARRLAFDLEGLNAQRKMLTNQVYAAALSQLDKVPERAADPILVLSGTGWPAGVIGIVASRLVEHFNRPVALITLAPGDVGRASARSIEGIDITSVLVENQAWLESFGGHAMAAGFSIQTEHIDGFRQAICQTLTRIQPASPMALTIDAEIELQDVSAELVGEIELLAPFGNGNPPPVFSSNRLKIVKENPLGREAEHRLLVVKSESGQQARIVWWQAADYPLPDGLVDLAFTIRSKNFLGKNELQFELIDIRQSADVSAIDLKPTITCHDYRFMTDPILILLEQHEPDWLIWAEAGERAKLQGMGIACLTRYELHPADSLVIWSLPPGRMELIYALGMVRPRSVWLFNPQAGQLNLRNFLKQLAGMLKYSLESQTALNLKKLVEATGVQEITVRKGLDWLQAQGVFILDLQASGQVEVHKGSGESVYAALASTGEQLQTLLSESNAFHEFYLRSSPETLMLY